MRVFLQEDGARGVPASFSIGGEQSFDSEEAECLGATPG